MEKFKKAVHSFTFVIMCILIALEILGHGLLVYTLFLLDGKWIIEMVQVAYSLANIFVLLVGALFVRYLTGSVTWNLLCAVSFIGATCCMLFSSLYSAAGMGSKSDFFFGLNLVLFSASVFFLLKRIKQKKQTTNRP